MNRVRPAVVVLGAALVFLVGASGCSETSAPDHTVELGYDFTVSDQGWDTGFADYPLGADSAMALTAERRDVPAPLDSLGEALYLAGSNTSDDLFMYLKRQITDLQPSRAYRIHYRIEVATNAPRGCVGIGGAPGESVYLKAGGAAIEPYAEAEPESGVQVWRMNVDKGQQAQGGAHAIVFGDIENGDPDCDNPVYRRKVFEGESVTVTSSPRGVLWLLVGTDSGFEGRTGLYYLSMDVTLES